MVAEVVCSLVSHGHGDLVLQALRAFATSVRNSSVRFRVLLTLNVPEPELHLAVEAGEWPFELVILDNAQPLGFGANHNQAFARSRAMQGAGGWFVVMNPDIFWPQQAGAFWQELPQGWTSQVGLVCPVQTDVDGQLQDFARHLITPWGLFGRVLRKALGASPSGVAPSVAQADWVNGACMVWRSEAFAVLKGFDERYFMYCEDADICLRLQLAGWHMGQAALAVVHDARRDTNRSWRHLRWHLSSMLRLWRSRVFWRYWWRKHWVRTPASHP